MLRGRMNASSTIFQNSKVLRVSIIWWFLQVRMQRPSTPMLKKNRDTVMRSASGRGLSSHIMPSSIRRWHLFCQFIFCCALRAFLSLSLSDCAEERTIVSLYIGSRGRSTISCLGPSSVSRMLFSFANSANFYCTLHFSQRRGGSGVGLSPKASIPRGLRHVVLYLNRVPARDAGSFTIA